MSVLPGQNWRQLPGKLMWRLMCLHCHVGFGANFLLKGGERPMGFVKFWIVVIFYLNLVCYRYNYVL